MRKFAITLLMPLCLMGGPCRAQTTGHHQPLPMSGDTGATKWVMGYYVGYLSKQQPIEAIGWEGLTHIALGVITPTPEGGLDYTGALDTPGRAKLVKTAHDHHRKAIAMIGGGATGPDWSSAASDTHRATFIGHLTRLVNAEGFDGLDLDWEPLEETHHPALLGLVKALRAELPKAILTFPAETLDNENLPLPTRTYLAGLAPYLDQINLMTYGMAHAHAGWKTWHSSPLYHKDRATPASVDFVANNIINTGVPAAKLGIGIGFFGACFGHPATAPLQPTKGMGKGGAELLAGDNDMSYTHIMTDYFPNGTRHWDDTAKSPYLSLPKPTGPKGCTYISYEDTQSILEKGQYVRDRGLGGAIIWNINEGYLAGQTPGNPLLEATRQAFID